MKCRCSGETSGPVRTSVSAAVTPTRPMPARSARGASSHHRERRRGQAARAEDEGHDREHRHIGRRTGAHESVQVHCLGTRRSLRFP